MSILHASKIVPEDAMKCPWRIITIVKKVNESPSVSEENETHTDFGECYEHECPFYCVGVGKYCRRAQCEK
jgi:hypothetical protein